MSSTSLALLVSLAAHATALGRLYCRTLKQLGHYHGPVATLRIRRSRTALANWRALPANLQLRLNIRSPPGDVVSGHRLPVRGSTSSRSSSTQAWRITILGIPLARFISIIYGPPGDFVPYHLPPVRTSIICHRTSTQAWRITIWGSPSAPSSQSVVFFQVTLSHILCGWSV